MTTAILQDEECSLIEYLFILGVRGFWAVIKAKLLRKTTIFYVSRAGFKLPIGLRVPSSDVRIYEQIFIRQDYRFDVNKDPAVIIDAGANTGLASIYFAIRFPNAKIIAIEPEIKNFELLRKNCAAYHNIVPFYGAIWDRNENINLIDPGFGDWGFQTIPAAQTEVSAGKHLYGVRGVTIDQLMRECGIDHVDVLKIDIEGAELEVFRDPAKWIDKIDSIVIEFHERMKPGCIRSFYNSTDGFDEEWIQGENVYLRRKTACLVKTAADSIFLAIY